MFVGCSEIIISVTIKYVQHIGIIRAFCLPGGVFQCMRAQKKNVELPF